jgi:uncharacterized membrane protein (UPF0127 family)
MRLISLCAVALCFSSCVQKQNENQYEANTIPLTLPNGQVIRVETMIHEQDMIKGMMFRDEMKPGHGMLFFHPQVANVSYWMYQVKIPLDIIWLDVNKKVVEMVENAPPCKTAPSQCPHYGGKEASFYGLELAGGTAKQYGLRVGESVAF